MEPPQHIKLIYVHETIQGLKGVRLMSALLTAVKAAAWKRGGTQGSCGTIC